MDAYEQGKRGKGRASSPGALKYAILRGITRPERRGTMDSLELFWKEVRRRVQRGRARNRCGGLDPQSLRLLHQIVGR